VCVPSFVLKSYPQDAPTGDMPLGVSPSASTEPGFGDTPKGMSPAEEASIPANSKPDPNEINALHENARFRSSPSGAAAQ